MVSKKLAAGIAVVIVVVVVGLAAFYLLTRQFTLTISVNPPNLGSVSLSSGENTSETITVHFRYRTSVTLTPIASVSGYVFNYWGGDASGDNVPITIFMDSNKVVTAYFVTPGD
jgi:hypothetical protein